MTGDAGQSLVYPIPVANARPAKRTRRQRQSGPKDESYSSWDGDMVAESYFETSDDLSDDSSKTEANLPDPKPDEILEPRPILGTPPHWSQASGGDDMGRADLSEHAEDASRCDGMARLVRDLEDVGLAGIDPSGPWQQVSVEGGQIKAESGDHSIHNRQSLLGCKPSGGTADLSEIPICQDYGPATTPLYTTTPSGHSLSILSVPGSELGGPVVDKHHGQQAGDGSNHTQLNIRETAVHSSGGGITFSVGSELNQVSSYVDSVLATSITESHLANASGGALHRMARASCSQSVLGSLLSPSLVLGTHCC